MTTIHFVKPMFSLSMPVPGQRLVVVRAPAQRVRAALVFLRWPLGLLRFPTSSSRTQNEALPLPTVSSHPEISLKGSKTVAFCKQDTEGGMVYVYGKRCSHRDWSTPAF